MLFLIIKSYILLFSLYNPLFWHDQEERDLSIDQALKEQCYTCSKSLVFYPYRKDYHSLHEAFSTGNLDSSFALCNEILQKSNKKKSEARYWLYGLKGRILKEKQLYNEAIQYISKAITIGETEGIIHVKNLYSLQAQVYYEIGEFHKAIDILEGWKATSNPKDINAHSNLHNLGLSYLQVKSYNKASINLLKSFAINKTRGDTLNMAKSAMDIGNLYYVQYIDSSAIPYFEKGLALAKKAEDLETLRNAYFNMAIVEENRKQYEKALYYRKEAEKVKDSIWNRDKIWELAQRDKALTIRLNQEKLASEKLKRYGALLFACISIVGTILIFLFWFQLKRKNHKIIQQKKYVDELNSTKDKLFTILSHDLKTPVHFLSDKLLSLSRNDGTKEIRLSNKVQECYAIAFATGLLIENTLQWALNNRDKLLFKIVDIHLKTIVDQVVYYFEPMIDLRKLKVIIQIPELCIIRADLNTLKIILRNILDNAVKYTSEGGVITLTTEIREKKVILIIENPTPETKTLKGMHTVYKTTGLGNQLCTEFATKNNGIFDLVITRLFTRALLSLPKSAIDDYISI